MNETAIGLLAVEALKRLLVTIDKQVVRLWAPSLKEINSIKLHQTLVTPIGLPDHTSRNISIEPYTTVDEAIVKLVKEIGLKSDRGYSFFAALSDDMGKYIVLFQHSKLFSGSFEGNSVCNRYDCQMGVG
jgi:hypothetical protein